LLQVFDYFPGIPGRGGGGRKHPNNKGIVGLSFERKTPEIENFHSDDDYSLTMSHFLSHRSQTYFYNNKYLL
jgi:hypothetical protein